MLCGIAQDAAVSVVFALFILPNGLWTCGCGQDGVRVDEAVCTGSKGGLSSLLAETVGTWEPPPPSTRQTRSPICGSEGLSSYEWETEIQRAPQSTARQSLGEN